MHIKNIQIKSDYKFTIEYNLLLALDYSDTDIKQVAYEKQAVILIFQQNSDNQQMCK